jgi:hypothetical protein
MDRNQYAALVEAQVGDRYILGAEAKASDHDPSVYDCHELVEWSYRHECGVVLNGPAAEQFRNTTPVVGQVQVGDLVFLSNNPLRYKHIGHVGIITRVGPDDDTTVIVEAKGRLFGVVRSTLAIWKRKAAFAGIRYLPAFRGACPEAAPVASPVRPPAKPQPSPAAKRVLRLGMSGNDVREVQRVLGLRRTTGYFGAWTSARVHAFQKRHGIDHDSAVGPITRAHMGI